MTDKEIKPGDHVTVSGTVRRVNHDYCHISFVTKSGLEIFVNPVDIQTHRPMEEEHDIKESI